MTALGIEAHYYSEPSPDHDKNEDFILAGPDFVVVLDGASPIPGIETGCLHDVPWVVRNLAAHLAADLATSTQPLPELLSVAIEKLCELHADTCDLSNPESPSATVAMLRRRGDQVDYLVLADSPIVFRMADGSVSVMADSRIDNLPDYSINSVRALRNNEDGFWVASTEPDAARHAITGTLNLVDDPIHSAAILTDGAATLVERHGRTWPDLLNLLDESPRRLIQMTRETDENDAQPKRGKRHDDATAVLCLFPSRAYSDAGCTP
ncbi:MAG: protein phosphatase 2C domain-containing protein [Nocardioides sp.]|nr:protein phosphatase 2C domain-containing protein [Nocardioides sp.]